MNVFWDDTPFQMVAAKTVECPTHRLAYFMGQVEQTIFEVFGVGPDDEAAPPEARQVAHLIMRTITTGGDMNQAVSHAGSIINAWRGRRVVN